MMFIDRAAIAQTVARILCCDGFCRRPSYCGRLTDEKNFLADRIVEGIEREMCVQHAARCLDGKRRSGRFGGPRRKLNQEQIAKLRAAAGSYTQLAKEFSISISTVGRYMRGERE